jgi:hypothetical protein
VRPAARRRLGWRQRAGQHGQDENERYAHRDPARNGDVINTPFVVDKELPASIGKLNCIASISGLSGKRENWRNN